MRPYAPSKIIKGYGMELYDTRGRPETSSARHAWKSIKGSLRQAVKREIRNELNGIDPTYPKRVGYRSWKNRRHRPASPWHPRDRYPYPYSAPDHKHPAEVEQQFRRTSETFAGWAYEARVARLRKRIASHPWLQGELDRLDTYRGKQAFIEAFVETDLYERRSFTGDEKLRRRERQRIRDQHFKQLLEESRKR